ncbi:MAG: sulfotransferase [Hyphomicrobiaceae bacterium]
MSAPLPATIPRYFVCVGAQKAGTTWLMRMLSAHPDIFVTPVKEIHYFDHVRGITRHLSDKKRRSRHRKLYQRLLTQWDRLEQNRQHRQWFRRYMADPIGDAWYRSLFEERFGRSFAGEATPEYSLIGADGYRHIQALAPEARVVFVMRSPVAQMWSQILHHCRSEGLDAARMSAGALVDLAGRERFAALGDYGATIDALRAVFPAEQLLFLFYEEIHLDRTRALEEVTGFIGARFSAEPFPAAETRFNRSQDVAAPEPVREALRRTLKARGEAVGARIGRLPEAWARELAP